MELYSTIMAECIFQKPSIQDQQSIQTHIDTMNKLALEDLGKKELFALIIAQKIRKSSSSK